MNRKLLGAGLLLSVFVLAILPITACRQIKTPKLVVLIAVDQLRTDYLTRFEGLYQGGFKWLLEQGAYYPDAAFRHSSTVTGVGHATVATGLHPSTHGIVGNSWYEQVAGDVYCVEDEDYVSVGGEGPHVSPLRLLADTLGDAIKSKHGGSRVYSFSRKDRSAVLMAGKKADGAFWYSSECGCLVGSSYYNASLPGWLMEFNAEQAASKYAGQTWERLLEDVGLYEKLARSDAFPTEADGEATVFPHQVPSEGYEDKLDATPFSDAITLGAAIAALESGELGSDGEPDLLALGLSATDSIGHSYGPFSQEAMDHHLRLDRMLGDFLEVLDRQVGLDNTVIALSADHGVMPLAEELQNRGVDAKRFDSSAFWKRAEPAITSCSSGAVDEVVATASGRQLHWNLEQLGNLGIDRGKASECVADWLSKQPEVDTVVTAEQLLEGQGSDITTLFVNSFYEQRSPHIQVHYREYLFPGGPRGTSHGSAHAYDRKVPVLVVGQGVATGSYSVPAGPEDIAPTLGKMLGLQMPLESDTRILSEALLSELGKQVP